MIRMTRIIIAHSRVCVLHGTVAKFTTMQSSTDRYVKRKVIQYTVVSKKTLQCIAAQYNVA